MAWQPPRLYRAPGGGHGDLPNGLRAFAPERLPDADWLVVQRVNGCAGFLRAPREKGTGHVQGVYVAHGDALAGVNGCPRGLKTRSSHAGDDCHVDFRRRDDVVDRHESDALRGLITPAAARESGHGGFVLMDLLGEAFKVGAGGEADNANVVAKGAGYR